MGEEPAECRICRCEGDEERPLFHPCACTGSIKWCHESCLVEWIKVSRTREVCETCNTELVFTSVYSDSTPETLSILELTWLGCKRLSKEVPFVLRAMFVVFVWLIFVPLWSANMFSYVRHSTEVEQINVESEITGFASLWSYLPISFVTWETGVWIIVAGFFCLFMLVSVFDFVRGFEMGEYTTELEMYRERGQIQVAEDMLPRAPRNGGGNRAVQGERNQGELVGENPELAHNDPDRPPIPEPNIDDFLEEDEADDFGRQNDVVEDLVGEQLGFDEWIGLRGPWCLMLNNVICLCFCVFMFLVTFYVVPESLGRGVFREVARVTVPLQDMMEHKGLVQPPPVCHPIAEPGHSGAWYKAQQVKNPTLQCSVDDLGHAARKLNSYFFEAMSVVTGLSAMILLTQVQFQVCSASWRTCVSRAFRPTFPFRGVPYYIWKSVLKSTRTAVRIQKVVCFLVFKMIAFPVVLGVMIDRALFKMVSFTDEERILFISEHPHLTMLVLWLVGITYTLLVTMNVILVRDILHQDVLEGIIRMRDPQGNHFLPFLVEPLLLQVKRTIVTCIVYTLTVYLFVTLPVQVLHNRQMLPLPISIHFFRVDLELPVEVTLFHMWMLHVLEKCKPTMVALQKQFFTFFGDKLGLTEYLLPRPRNHVVYAMAERRVNIQAGHLHWLDTAPRPSSDLLLPRITPSFLYPRIAALLVAAWICWLGVAVLCLVVPFVVGLAAVSCLPGIPNWARYDIRLYFLGWTILRSLHIYGPRSARHLYEQLNKVSGDVREVIALCFGILVFSVSIPTSCGYLVYLESAFSDQDFPEELYMLTHSQGPSSNIVGFLRFAKNLLGKVPIARAWLAGLPLFVLISTKTAVGKAFWRHVLKRRFTRAGQLAVRWVGIVWSSLGIGIFWGLDFCNRSVSRTYSPLLSVRVFVCFTLVCHLIPVFVFKYSGPILATYSRLHDTLKDEKYLIGRRLKNYDARV